MKTNKSEYNHFTKKTEESRKEFENQSQCPKDIYVASANIRVRDSRI